MTDAIRRSGSSGSYTTVVNVLAREVAAAFSEGLLDAYPSALVAYSFRKLRVAYAGSAVRIRRSSDNAEADIGFNDEDFDTAAAAAHIGGGSGFITTWYDQSGNGYNLTQTTSGNQPLYDAAGLNSAASMYFDATNDYLSVTNVDFTNSGVLYGIQLGSVDTGSAADRGVFCMLGNGEGADYNNVSSFGGKGIGIDVNSLATGTISLPQSGAPARFAAIFNGTNVYAERNRAPTSTASGASLGFGGTSNLGTFAISARLTPGAGNYRQGFVSEQLIYLNSGSNAAAIDRAIARYWMGSTVAAAPTSISNLVAWYSADSGVYNDAGSTLAADNDLVHQWNDQSGNGNHLIQATSGNRPTYDTTGFNTTKKGITFTASGSDYMTTATDDISIGGVQTLTCGVVFYMTSSTQNFGRLISFSLGSAGDANSATAFSMYSSAGGNITVHHNASATTVGVTGNSLLRLVMVCNGTDRKIYANNALMSTTADTNTWGATGTLRLGTEFPPALYIDGTYAEVVMYNKALSASELTQLDNYFVDKWSL